MTTAKASSQSVCSSIQMLKQLSLDANPVCDESMIKVCTGACLHHFPSHGVGLITLPLPALLALPDVTLLAPVVQAITPHPVASELTGRLLLSTRLAHLPLHKTLKQSTMHQCCMSIKLFPAKLCPSASCMWILQCPLWDKAQGPKLSVSQTPGTMYL